jgi:hypothetical protein
VIAVNVVGSVAARVDLVHTTTVATSERGSRRDSIRH